MKRLVRSPNKRYGHIATRLLLFAFLVVGFQNCGSCQSNSPQFSAAMNQSSSGNSGNGEPYEGKPGTYYRMGVAFECAGQKTVASKIEIRGAGITAVDTNPHDCTKTEATLLPSDIEGSKLGVGEGQLGFREGIYEYKSNEPDLGDPNLETSETWCSAELSNSETVEVTIRRRLGDNATSLFMKFADAQNSASPAVDPPLTQAVTRSLSGNQLSYFGDQFRLSVNLDQSAGRTGEKYTSHVNASIHGRQINTDLLCRSEAKPKPICPANYVDVPALSGFTDSDVCVAKYEMKVMGSASGNQAYSPALVAESRADGTPWVQVNKAQSITACQALGPGFDLMRNDEWMALSRNLERVPWNWSNGTLGSAGGLSRSYGMSAPAEAGTDDNACINTGVNCDLATWNAQRRVHRLSTGALIWDVGGNADEWMKDEVSRTYSYEAWSRITEREFLTQWGPLGTYTNLNSIPFGGLGEVLDNVVRGALTRSGGIGAGGVSPVAAGIFSLDAGKTGSEQQSDLGFRCVFRPTDPKTQTLFVESSEMDLAPVSNTQQTELGVRFESASPGVITAIRFYRAVANPAGYTVSLWTDQGALLAAATGSDGAIPGWQEINLPTPVSIQAGQVYVASYNSSNGQYMELQYGLTLPISRGLDLRALPKGGVYKDGSGFPTANFVDSDYLVDIRFQK